MGLHHRHGENQQRGENTADLVVIGLGYVGLPLARAAVRAGLRVVGFDTDVRVVTELNTGISRIDDISGEALALMRAGGFAASADAAVIAEAQAAVICVPTPLTPLGAPDLTAVEDAARAVAGRLRPGMLVVLESTTYPGTTQDIVRPLLEESGLRAGKDFHLAYSPERIDPGNRHYGLENTPKVIGGLTPDCTKAARRLYERFVGEIVEAKGPREAELSKLLENIYRHVNIALVNEMAMFSREIGVDLWDAIRCARTKPFGFEAFYPGPGVGGHCIPIDPNYLSHKVRSLGIPFRFVELAQEINQQMPRYVANRAVELLRDVGRPVRGARVLLVGITYKPDVSDQRETPAAAVLRELRGLGAQVAYYDPRIPDWTVGGVPVERALDLTSHAEAADITLLLQPHSEIDTVRLADHAALLFDTRGRTAGHPRAVQL